MNKTTIKTSLLFVLLGLALAATSCRTMEGVGEDVETAGEEIQESAR